MSESALDVNTGAELLASMLSDAPQEAAIEKEKTLEEQAQELESSNQELQESEEESVSEKVTIQVDGKAIELTPEEIAEAYKNGLRQSDYTKKTMETAEARKQAEAEYKQASTERTEYANKLNFFAQSLQTALNEQSQTNWAELLESDPVEYLKQQHLYQDRQAKLYQAQQEQQQVFALQQQEQQKAYANYLQGEQQQLLAKLPAWKDDSKAKAEKAEIKSFLMEQGFTDQDISQVADHRHVLLVRQAMQFQKLLKNAPDATKRVEKAPLRVERAGNSESNNTDVRQQAMRNLGKKGTVEAGASYFASIL